ncbi:MAG: hypothetical protein ACK2T0_08180 [Anaerolineales bacterium]|jgi:hypothetical protein
MSNPAVLAVLLILALVIVAGNTLLAVAFLRGRKGKSTSRRADDDSAMDELHARVQQLDQTHK